MSLIQRGRIWHVRVQVAGVMIAKSTKTSNKRTAEQLEAKWIAEVHKEVVMGGRKPATVQEVFKAFLEARRGTKGYASCEVKLRAFEPFLKLKMHEVQAKDLQSHMLDLVQEEGYSVNTINVSIIYWNAIQNFCLKAGFTAGVKIKRIKGGSNRVRFLSEQEIALIRNELNPSNAVYREKRKAQDNADFFEFLIGTGARENEIATMQLSQIDTEKNTITIIRSKGGTNTTMKMSKNLTEVLARRMVAAEQEWPEGRTMHGRVADGYLFPERAKGRYNNEFLTRACERLKLKDVCLHTLRHSAAVRWLTNGLSIVEVQHMLGHKNLNSTMVYAHLVPNLTAERAAEIQNRIDQIS